MKNDDGVALGALHFLPRAIADVFFLRNDDRRVGVIVAEHDLTLERFLERSLEMAERFGTDPADAAVLVAHRRDSMFSFWLDARKLEFFGEDVGQLVEREIDLHDVTARLSAPKHFSLASRTVADDIAFLAFAGADAAGN